MKRWLEDLVRPAVRAMRPYASARSAGNGPEGAVLLDANECPWPGSGPSSNRYPEPKPAALVSALGRIYGAEAARLFVGRGSDEAIDCLVRCFCEAGRSSILTLSPSYGVYETAAEVQGAAVVRVPLSEDDGFAFDPQRAVAAMREDTKLVFLCSPNNPTGASIAAAAVRDVCAAVQRRALVVLDEAYVEFSELPSLAPEAGQIPNLVVLRTLSKAWGLAGLRVGAAAADEEVVELLDRVRAPYPLPRPSVDAALLALKDREGMLERVRRVLEQRARLSAGLRACGRVRKVFESDANFLLVRLRGEDGAQAAARLRAAGVLARGRGEYLRVSVGSAQENGRLLAALGAVGEGACAR